MRLPICAVLCLAVLLVAGCRSAASYRREADNAAAGIIHAKQPAVTGRTAVFTVEPPLDTFRRRIMAAQGLAYSSAASLGTDQLNQPEHWPEPRKGAPPPLPTAAPNELGAKDAPLVLTLKDALQIGAQNSREYQTLKEAVFQAALKMDLEDDKFRSMFFGMLAASGQADTSSGETRAGVGATAEARWQRRLQNGATLTSRIAFDLAKLITSPHSFASGVFADASITVPLLAGSGRYIVTEPLTQAERDVDYALLNLERFRSTYAVQVATQYLSVLQTHDRILNTEANYKRLIAATRLAQRLSEAGRVPGIDADESRQDELSARDDWISAREAYKSQLDRFKTLLGLPPDANIELDLKELGRLVSEMRQRLDLNEKTPAVGSAEQAAADAPIQLVEPERHGRGFLALSEDDAVRIALSRRVDLRVRNAQVDDAQRAVIVAADALRANLSFTAVGQAGERRSINAAVQPDASLRFDRGVYGLGLTADLPWERTAQRNAYRNSLISLEQAVRSVQSLEDDIKLQVRDEIRNLFQARESARIQSEGVRLAERRVRNANLSFQAGRAKVRDLLFAQTSLLSAQNALTAALRNYRVAELELQRDMGVLEITDDGLWREYEVDDNR